MDSIRWRMCSAFIRSVLICSFKTLIRPSRFPRFKVSWAWALRPAVTFSSRTVSAASNVSYSLRMVFASFWTRSRSWDTMDSFFETDSIWPFNELVSARKRLASRCFKFSFNRRYSLAAWDCFSNGPTCFSSSLKISLTLTRLWRSSSSFFWAMAFLRLNFTMPAASSNSSLRSSGFPLKILSICPCPIMEYPSFPIPVS